MSITSITGIEGSRVAFVAGDIISKRAGQQLVITPTFIRAGRLAGDLSFFTDSLDITADWVGVPQNFRNCVRILSTRNWYGSRSLTIESNQEQGIVKAFFI